MRLRPPRPGPAAGAEGTRPPGLLAQKIGGIAFSQLLHPALRVTAQPLALPALRGLARLALPGSHGRQRSGSGPGGTSGRYKSVLPETTRADAALATSREVALSGRPGPDFPPASVGRVPDFSRKALNAAGASSVAELTAWARDSLSIVCLSVWSAWMTRDAAGSGVAPRTRIPRVACSMTASTNRRVPSRRTKEKQNATVPYTVPTQRTPQDVRLNLV